ncbi:MAG: type II secretion system F family protein [Myxococcota bacterium]
MNELLASTLAGYVSLGLFALGAGVFTYQAFALSESPFRSAWERYVGFLGEYTRFLLLRTSPAQIARTQLVVIAALAVLLAATGHPLVLLVIVLAAIAPYASLDRQKNERIVKLEQQLDGWMLLLSNSLKATPAIGEAIKSTVTLVQAPMSEELDLLVKQNQLGTPLDQALLNASERMGSPTISGALSTLVIARQTGGDLPTILERSAASLREMARLEGVVRTKTAEGKGQVIVLAVMPFAMVLLLSWADPHWLDPLLTNFVGYIIMAIALACWLLAIVWARNILDVDI